MEAKSRMKRSVETTEAIMRRSKLDVLSSSMVTLNTGLPLAKFLCVGERQSLQQQHARTTRPIETRT
jgi:hypothetical protein